MRVSLLPHRSMPVERYLADVKNRMRAGTQLADEITADVWMRTAAAEARRWRRRFLDEDIPRLLKQAIRLDPFILRRALTPE